MQPGWRVTAVEGELHAQETDESVLVGHFKEWFLCIWSHSEVQSQGIWLLVWVCTKVMVSSILGFCLEVVFKFFLLGEELASSSPL